MYKIYKYVQKNQQCNTTIWYLVCVWLQVHRVGARGAMAGARRSSPARGRACRWASRAASRARPTPTRSLLSGSARRTARLHSPPGTRTVCARAGGPPPLPPPPREGGTRCDSTRTPQSCCSNDPRLLKISNHYITSSIGSCQANLSNVEIWLIVSNFIVLL